MRALNEAESMLLTDVLPQLARDGGTYEDRLELSRSSSLAVEFGRVLTVEIEQVLSFQSQFVKTTM